MHSYLIWKFVLNNDDFGTIQISNNKRSKESLLCLRKYTDKSVGSACCGRVQYNYIFFSGKRDKEAAGGQSHEPLLVTPLVKDAALCTLKIWLSIMFLWWIVKIKSFEKKRKPTEEDIKATMWLLALRRKCTKEFDDKKSERH